MSTFYNDLAGAPKFTLLPCLLLFLRAVGENQGQEGKFFPDFVPNFGLMIFRKSLLFNIFSKEMIDFATQQFCHVEFPFKFFDKMVNKRDFLEKINL